MKLSREFILLGSIVGVLAAGTVFYWSHQQVEQIAAAGIESTQALTAHRAAVNDTNLRLGHLKAQLLDVQREDRVPPSYEEWSRQQAESRAAVAAIRQHFGEIAPSPASPIAPQPALVIASAKLRELGGRLLAQWQEFEQLGSGLTPASRALANANLLPLLADELQPALEEFAAADNSDAERRASAFPALLAPARRIMYGAAGAFAACFGLLVYSLVPRRKTSEKLLSAAWQKSGAADAPPPPAAAFEHNVAAMDRSIPKILVAEHNSAESDTLSLLLTNAGYAVIGCDKGSVARDAIQRLPFALLILDLRLPEHGGLEILNEARKTNARLPALIICDPQEDTLHLEAGGSNLTQVVRRPLNPRTLLWSVSEILYPGENRQPREYSPNLPDPEDVVPPADTPPAAERPAPAMSAPPFPAPRPPAEPATPLVRRVRLTTTPAPSPEPPPPAPLPPPPARPAIIPAPVAAAPAPIPESDTTPALPRRRLTISSPSESPSPPPPAPPPPAPEPIAALPPAAEPNTSVPFSTATPAGETSAPFGVTNAPFSTDSGAPMRRKVVRRKILPADET